MNIVQAFLLFGAAYNRWRGWQFFLTCFYASCKKDSVYYGIHCKLIRNISYNILILLNKMLL